MFQGLDRLNQAVQILVGRNATLNQRLYEAANEFSAAMSHSDQWPAKLLARAAGIAEKLTAQGEIAATINAMDIAVAGSIAEDMLSLTVAMNAADAVANRSRSMHLPPGKKRRRRRRLDLSEALD